MDDLISRKAAIDAVMRLQPYSNKRELIKRIESSIADAEGYLGGIAMSLDELEDLDSIDAEPVRNGRWININDSEKYQCSECGITMWFPKSLDVTPDTYIFCPHCGAEMTEGKKKSGRTNHERTNKSYLC